MLNIFKSVKVTRLKKVSVPAKTKATKKIQSKPSRKPSAKATAKPKKAKVIIKAKPAVQLERAPNETVAPFFGSMVNKDLAHAPGHRKIDLKANRKEPRGDEVKIQKSSLSRLTPADQMRRNTSQIRIRGMAAAHGRGKK